MYVNLTPHPLHIYPLDTPDRIEPGSVAAARIIPPSSAHPPARLGQTVLDSCFRHDGIVVEDVAFGPEAGHTAALPDPVAGTWYIESLVVGLSASTRDDLLVPHAYVRDLEGSIIGPRKLARPSRFLRPEPTAEASAQPTAIAMDPLTDPIHGPYTDADRDDLFIEVLPDRWGRNFVCATSRSTGIQDAIGTRWGRRRATTAARRYAARWQLQFGPPAPPAPAFDASLLTESRTLHTDDERRLRDDKSTL
ncbi:hypothetical protein [Virgisporangium aurantiacum]|uniref:Uncharacterized protein n=1 Tax=Virgisporangium aurantiacum TaxID=175570 RepID=A0A8J3ZK05_9ACTN|nr:hypothetical protein [Virgisporangium aurantiacum]GIJ64357.1 hypothetical protein Vau01_118730 [Virgisporangium aurantiacum]